jgi:hypothetical protein
MHQIRSYREKHAGDILDELLVFLAIPNVASDLPNIQRNAAHLLGMLRGRGADARLLEAPGTRSAPRGASPR